MITQKTIFDKASIKKGIAVLYRVGPGAKYSYGLISNVEDEKITIVYLSFGGDGVNHVIISIDTYNRDNECIIFLDAKKEYNIDKTVKIQIENSNSTEVLMELKLSAKDDTIDLTALSNCTISNIDIEEETGYDLYKVKHIPDGLDVLEIYHRPTGFRGLGKAKL